MTCYKDVNEETEYLNVSNQNLGVNGICDLCVDLREDTILRQLDLSHNINLEEAHEAKVVRVGSFLNKTFPGPYSKFIESFSQLIRKNKTVTALDFVGNHLGLYGPHPRNEHLQDYVMEFMKLVVRSNISRLDISDNLITGELGRKYR